MGEVVFSAILQNFDPVLFSGNVEHVQEVGEVLRLGLGLQRRRELLMTEKNGNVSKKTFLVDI